MLKTLLIISTALVLTACQTTQTTAPVNGPQIVSGVIKRGPGLYSVSEQEVLIGDPLNRAVRQCEIDGKPLNVVGNTTKTGTLSGDKYAVILFKCG